MLEGRDEVRPQVRGGSMGQGSPPESALRVAMAACGVGVVVAWSIWFAHEGPELVPKDCLLVGAGLLVALIGGIRWIPTRWAASFAVMGALLGYLLWTWSYQAVPFPCVDIVRPWGMDKGPWPVFRPLLGLLVLVFVTTAVTARRRPPGRAVRWLGVAACLLVIGFWVIPRFYEVDLITEEGRIPDLPQNFPRPGRVGEGATPAWLDGQVRYIHWTQYAHSPMPLRAVSRIAEREWVNAALAHGMYQVLEEASVARGEIPPGSAALRSSLRGILWPIQVQVGRFHIYLQVASLPLWVWLGWRLLRRGTLGPRMGRLVAGVLGIQTMGVFVLNLCMVTLMLVARMPEVSRGGVPSAVGWLGLSAACVVLWLAGRAVKGRNGEDHGMA